MPNTIPAYFAQRQATTSGLPRAPAAQLADTGQGIEAQAIAEFGGALADTSAILTKWYVREGNSQFDTSRANVQDMLTGFEQFPFPDADSHKAGYKKLLVAIDKEAPKNKSGAAKFKSWTRLNKESFDKLSNEKMIRMIAKQNQISLFDSLNRVSNITDRKKAMAEIKFLVQGGLDDGSIKTAAQAISLQEKATNDWLEADVWRRATSTVRPDGEVDFSEAVKWFGKAENIKGIPSEVIDSMLENARTQANLQKGRDNEKLEAQQEEDRDTISKAIRASDPNTISMIENSYLDETEQFTWQERARAEGVRAAKGVDITTNHEVRSAINSGIFQMLTGAKTKKEVLEEAKVARFGSREKGEGFLGVLELPDGGITTEYSVGVQLEANQGKETEIPSLVPTLTKAEISLMVNDIIPNKKAVPEKILQKAVDHANKRVREGKSPFFEEDGKLTQPTLSDSDYNKIETAINAQYEQAYTGAMSKVNAHAMGTLLNPDSLGYIKNAPVRYKTMADFQQAWMKWIADKGDTLKVSDIYPEGVRMAAMYQISDAEAERQEVEMNAALAEREKPLITPKGTTLKLPPPFVGKLKLPAPPTKPARLKLEKAVGKTNAEMEMDAWQVVFDMWNHFDGSTQKKIRKARDDGKSFTEIVSEGPLSEEISKRIGAVDTPHRVLPRPTNKEQYDSLPIGTRYIAPNGMELTKR